MMVSKWAFGAPALEELLSGWLRLYRQAGAATDGTGAATEMWIARYAKHRACTRHDSSKLC